MSMIDYGVIIKKNGEFINKDKGLFMKCPNFVHDKYRDNYFCYLGDKDCYVMTYKGCLIVVINGEMEWICYDSPFLSQTRYCENFNIKIEHLDKNYVYEYYEDYGKSWEELVDEYYYYPKYDGERSYDPYDLEYGNEFYKRMLKIKKQMSRTKGICYKYLTNRYRATWEYKGDKYEIIFGYGIDNKEDVWYNIRDKWKYTDNERSIIDEWFRKNL